MSVTPNDTMATSSGVPNIPRRPRTTPKRDYTVLLPHEEFWRDHQPWLVERGYQLRPRYRPGWVASWVGKEVSYWDCEDGQHTLDNHLLDATRISDGGMVMLKRISHEAHPHEAEIGRMFSEEPRKSHPKNHCIPILEVLDVPNQQQVSILVMPMLRPYNKPRLKSIGEAVEYFRQVFEGLQFMHECHVAHRDCMNLNIMMDPKPGFPNMFHPQDIDRSRDWKSHAKYYTRTARPVKYYFIDFGLSRKYLSDDTSPREDPIWGGDKTVPEFQNSDDPCDPFPTDIYYLGNMIREDFLQKTRGLEFVEPLVNDMVQADPSKRPTIHKVVDRFEQLRQPLHWWTLRSRLPEEGETGFDRLLRATHHLFRTTAHVLTFRSALPTPS